MGKKATAGRRGGSVFGLENCGLRGVVVVVVAVAVVVVVTKTMAWTWWTF